MIEREYRFDFFLAFFLVGFSVVLLSIDSFMNKLSEGDLFFFGVFFGVTLSYLAKTLGANEGLRRTKKEDQKKFMEVELNEK